MHQLELKNGGVYLDGERIKCIKSFNIASSEENKGTAELTICMKVKVRNEDKTGLKQ